MAFVSVVPLSTNVFLYDTEKRRSFTNSIPSLHSTTQRRTFQVRPVNINVTSASISSKEAVKRRKGNHHPNLWEDDFIQLLEKNYETSSYAERAESLISEVKDMFNATSSAEDLFERLSLVDSVERLGISRHFPMEIKEALDYVYRHWDDKGIGRGRESACTDLNTTALGLRILRLHRYNVSSDVLEHFKEKNGQFMESTSEAEATIQRMLNLYKASQIAFPAEKVIEETKAFTTTYLKEALRNIESSSLSREIELALEYGWHASLARLDARNYIDIYKEDISWVEQTTNKMSHASNIKLLDLAVLDFNMIQKLQRQELQILSSWIVESGLSNLTFARHRHVEYYFMAAGICGEPKYRAFRMGLAKLCALATYIDDIYDTHGTLDELRLFTDTIKRWDPSAMDCLPEYMKIAYMALYETVNEMAREADKTQGRDTLDLARKAWEDNIEAYMREAEWIAAQHIPTFQEYLDNGKVSGAVRVVTLQPVLTLDAPLSENILPKIDYPSRFDELLCVTFRLRGDIRTFKAEAARGEIASSLTSYIRDHPESTEADALNYLTAFMEELLTELNWEYLKPDDVPAISKDYAYAISRGLNLFYRERDGFSNSTQDIKNHVTKLLIQPLTM